MTRIRRCGNCSSKNILRSNVIGRTFPYKTYSAVQLSVDLQLNVCTDCDNIIYTKGDAQLIDEAIKSSIIQQSESFIGNIIKHMGWKQKELASYLGYTSVYISELKNGKKIADLKTFNYLKVLSECEGAIECIIKTDDRCEKPRYQLPKVKKTKRSNISVAGNEQEFAMAA